jgi:hypothetical protein
MGGAARQVKEASARHAERLIGAAHVVLPSR